MPAVAGMFYPSDPDQLEKTLEFLFDQAGGITQVNTDPIPPAGLVSPHAGYIYSGKTAAFGYREIAQLGKPNTVFIIGPDHTGYASKLSISSEDAWYTPLGEIEVDKEIVNHLIEKLEFASLDDFAHKFEHSLEVQLPFLQYLYQNYFKIVPIMMGNQSSKVSEKLAEVLKEYKKPGSLFIASTDLNHYEDHQTTIRKGEKIIEAIENLDSQLLYENIVKFQISMCGYGPVATLLNMGFKNVKILYHTTSAETSGDRVQTVGYLSALLKD